MTGIDWGAFLLVAVVSIVSACVVVAVYAIGLRLWSWADTMDGRYGLADDGSVVPADEGVPVGRRSPGLARTVRSGAVLCFAVCGAIVLYGVYLVIPQLH